ncbi:hypothetical protein ACQSNP_003881 [Cronobacter sakazakii]
MVDSCWWPEQTQLFLAAKTTLFNLCRLTETRYDSVERVTQRTVLDARRELMFERRYRWDRTDQIVQQIHTDTTPATPGEKYSQYLWGYDAVGQVTKAVEP